MTIDKPYVDHQYEDLLLDVLENGNHRPDRTGTGTRGVFGRQIRYDLSKGFPMITTKAVWWKGVVAELLWLLSGDTNVKTLQKQGVHIWDEWADEDGSLGPVYGHQWRHWDSAGSPGGYTDQIAQLIHNLRKDPFSRRHIVSAWNVDDIHRMALAPCHTMFQFFVEADEDGKPSKLSCQLYQRSGDLFLGIPFNIASYALLTCMIAAQVGLEPGEFVHTFGDAHIYNNHVEQVELQLSREPYPFPTLELDKVPSIFRYGPENIRLVNYQRHPKIEAPVAV